MFNANLPEPPEEQFYQAWMIQSDEAPFNAGTLSMKEEGVYSLQTDHQFDPIEPYFTTFDTIHNTMAISLESADDQTMETKILEGTFTE